MAIQLEKMEGLAGRVGGGGMEWVVTGSVVNHLITGGVTGRIGWKVWEQGGFEVFKSWNTFEGSSTRCHFWGCKDFDRNYHY